MKTKRVNKIKDYGSYLTHDAFFPEAKKLRQVFEQNFADPKATSSGRFVWDYWHVPSQYTLVRTPAYYYFPQELYKSLHESLLQFGREHLGCYNMTPPWLSYYVEGCRQELHADVPHGPWAFVYSLTPWKGRKFSGGETLLLKPSTLNYWTSFENFKGVEMNDLTTRIPAEFNRLVLFDPRIPHGVTPVHGTHDPREARLVIHGWFTEPEPYVQGALSRKAATSKINEILEDLSPLFDHFPDVHGSLSLRFSVGKSGEVGTVSALTNTLLSLTNENRRVSDLLRAIEKTILQSRFPRARGPTWVTLPILFRF